MAVDSLEIGAAQLFSKVIILLDIRRAAAVNIAREKAMSIINPRTNRRKYDSLRAYIFNEIIVETTERAEQERLLREQITPQ